MNKDFWVMTANLAGQQWMGWETRKDIAAEIIGRYPADLIGFQEFGLDNWNTLEKALPQLRLISGKAAGDILINSICYNHKLFEPLASDTLWLAPDRTYGFAWYGAPRGATWAHFRRLEDGKEFGFINPHFDNKSALARESGVALAIKVCKEISHSMPWLLTADSNVSVDSPDPRWHTEEARRPYVQMLDAGFVDCWRATHPDRPARPFTFHGFQGEKYFPDSFGTWDTEWIFARGFTPLECMIITDSIRGIYPSDHYWMRARVEF